MTDINKHDNPWVQIEQLQMEIERLRVALSDEREACANVADHFTGSLWTPVENRIAKLIAAAIREQTND